MDFRSLKSLEEDEEWNNLVEGCSKSDNMVYPFTVIPLIEKSAAEYIKMENGYSETLPASVLVYCGNQQNGVPSIKTTSHELPVEEALRDTDKQSTSIHDVNEKEIMFSGSGHLQSTCMVNGRKYLRELICRLCSEKLSRYAYYELHWNKRHAECDKKHMYDKPVVCPVCNKHLPNIFSIFMYHMKRHKDVNMSKSVLKAIHQQRYCFDCKKAFSHNKSFHNHRNKEHNELIGDETHKECNEKTLGNDEPMDFQKSSDELISDETIANDERNGLSDSAMSCKQDFSELATHSWHDVVNGVHSDYNGVYDGAVDQRHDILDSSDCLHVIDDDYTLNCTADNCIPVYTIVLKSNSPHAEDDENDVEIIWDESNCTTVIPGTGKSASNLPAINDQAHLYC